MSYKEMLTAFTTLIAAQRNTNFTIEGKKFDKIALVNTGKVVYFVERSTGNIFGAKSNTIINRHRFFGHISNVAKWDWSGTGGVNVSDDSVVESGHYGAVKHYVPKQAETATN